METQDKKALLKRLFSFSGRATRKDFWLTALGLFIVTLICVIICSLLSLIDNTFGGTIFMLLAIPLIIANWANTFRRIHDLGLSGFWTCYLSPIGLPFLYCSYVMDADESAKAVVERIKNIGTPWLGWVLSFLFWPLASFFGLLLILLSPGQNKDNIYGSNPYSSKDIVEK